MKLVNLKNPVMASWMREQGARLDAPPFLSGAIEARKLLELLSVKKEPLASLTKGHNGGIYNGPMFRRNYVTDPEHGVPFLTSSGILLADLSTLPLLSKKDAHSSRLSYLRLREGMTLISCSGSIGRMSYARPEMDGIWSSQDVLKVVPSPDRILPGYLYAFLSSKFGLPLVVGGTYGAIIQHIEPHHIADLPVPRLGEKLEASVHKLEQEAAELRSQFQAELETATREFFEAAGLSELYKLQWHSQPRDLGYVVQGLSTKTLRALNFIPRFTNILDNLNSVPNKTLGEICTGGQLGSGVRFKRIDCDPEHGVRLIGQRQAFWIRPTGRWISPQHAPPGIFAKDETAMVAAQGTLGENEVFCQPILVTGQWLTFAYSQHFLRIASGDDEYPGAYLLAFLRSEAAFRCFRSMSIGSKQQDLHPSLLAQFPIPSCTPTARKAIAERVRFAHRMRDEADEKEDKALALLESAIDEAS